MKVFFEDYNTGLCRQIGHCLNESEAMKIMNKYLSRYVTTSKVFKIKTRISTNEDVFSFGSKTQYFVIEKTA